MSTNDLLHKASVGSMSTFKENTSVSKENGAESSAESSQSIVDELFKDFIKKKISKTNKSTAGKDSPKPAKVDEISKLLDLEISSIQAQTKEPADKVKELVSKTQKQATINQNVCNSFSTSQRLSAELNNFPDQNTAADIPLPPQDKAKSISKTDNDLKMGHKRDLSAISSASFSSSLASAPTPVSSSIINSVESQGSVSTASKPIVTVGKKMNIPKQLGCKLSTESLSLIKSNEKIDRNGRVWEDGEVQSSHSEGSNKEDSDSDDYGNPSETGSINSDKEDWKSQGSSKRKKKHHKHKHKKKKKKKSSKEKEHLKGSEDEKDAKKEREKDKDKRNKKEREQSSSAISSHKDLENVDRDKKNDEKVKRRDYSDSSNEKSRGKGSDSESPKKESKSADREKSDSKKREKEKKRKHERSRSRTPKRSKKSRSRSKSPRKTRRSASPKRSRYSEWDARRYSDDSKKLLRSRSRSGSRSRSKRRRSSERKRDRSKERGREQDRDLRLQIDKAKLRKIAIANALNSMKSGQQVPIQLDVAAVKSGGKSVEELTDFCKRISEKEQEKQDNAISDSSEEEITAQTDEEEPLIHHPFKVKEASSNIVMNIRNAKQLPVLTPSEKQAQQATLRLAYPVSSGSHHRASESEWVPVEKTTAQTTNTISRVLDSQASTESQPEPSQSVFPSAPQNVDIGAIITERLQAVRKLQANPYDVQALSSMHKVQEKASQWAQSKHLPGQFVGSTGAQVMSQEQIMGDKRRQAWVKKTQFNTAAPVSGGIGMFLLQKMGWKQGEGLGKNNEGTTQPLQLDIKIDRKGLSSAADNPKAKHHIPHVPQAKDLSHKHPVSALMELCNKRRWGPPCFTVVSENGPDHKKCFLFKVKVNNVEYQPAVPSSNKKSAKAQCAAVCLQEMGLLPKDAHMNY